MVEMSWALTGSPAVLASGTSVTKSLDVTGKWQPSILSPAASPCLTQQSHSGGMASQTVERGWVGGQPELAMAQTEFLFTVIGIR